MNVPLLSLVNVPALTIDTVSVKFVVEVDAMSTTSSATSSEVDSSWDIKAHASYGFGAFKAGINVDYNTSTKLTNTTHANDSLNTRATYTIDIEAKNQPPVGLLKMLDILSSKINSKSTAAVV